VVLVDVQIAGYRAPDVDQRVARELFNHVVEEADSGRHFISAGAVEIHLDCDIGLLGFAGDPGSAHVEA
jgi:hypothetical protein